MSSPRPRPVFLDLRRIRLPVTGWVSILHRVSGVVLFVSTPLFVYLLDMSLRSAEGFHKAASLLGQPLSKLWLLLVAWSIFHHLFAGIRFLLLDFHLGVERLAARRSARGVIIAASLTAIVVWVVWL
jgi:succinate dehydrogenase / fumarate reductase cytochrome b subunit